jgi:Replication-relaxation
MSVSPQDRAPARQIGVEIMTSVYQHWLLSTAQLHAMHCPTTSMQWVRQVLSELRELGYVTAAKARGTQSGGHPMRLWFLTERGADTVELTPRSEERRIIVSDSGAAGQLQAHTLAVNDAAGSTASSEPRSSAARLIPPTGAPRSSPSATTAAS